MLTPELDQFIRRMPKVELHIHLEGAASSRTLLELANRNEVPIPAWDLASIEELYTYNSFGDFLTVFMALTRAIVKYHDFEQVAYEMGRMLAQQNVLYAEVMLSPMQHLLNGINLLQAVAATAEGFQRAEEESGIVVRLALDYGRQYGTDYAWNVLDIARRAMEYGVVAWSIGGNEIHHPPEPFAEVFAAARAAGLHVMAHAGEVAGPASVWGAVDALQVERVGHGIRSVDDPALVRYLVEQEIVLDVSPSSNILTGAASSWETHSLRQLYDAGVIVTVNSDDPTFFRTTLTDEYRRITRYFGFNADDLCNLVLNSVRGSFLPPAEKERLHRRVQHELSDLRFQLGV
jgi:adenosine deaminase